MKRIVKNTNLVIFTYSLPWPWFTIRGVKCFFASVIKTIGETTIFTCGLLETRLEGKALLIQCPGDSLAMWARLPECILSGSISMNRPLKPSSSREASGEIDSAFPAGSRLLCIDCFDRRW